MSTFYKSLVATCYSMHNLNNRYQNERYILCSFGNFDKMSHFAANLFSYQLFLGIPLVKMLCMDYIALFRDECLCLSLIYVHVLANFLVCGAYDNF